MNDEREAELLLDQLKQALDHNDEPTATRIRAEIDAIAKRNARLTATIAAMLATL